MTLKQYPPAVQMAVEIAKRRHGRAAYESFGYYLQAWIDQTEAVPSAGVRLAEGRAIYRKLGDLLKEQGII